MTDYLTSFAELIRSFVPERDLPTESHRDRLFRIYAVLALAKGAAVTAEDVHNAWVAWMAELDPEHPALRRFAELDRGDQQEDAPYVEAIRAALSSQPE